MQAEVGRCEGGKQSVKILGISCGRRNGNGEVLLKEACLEAHRLGAEIEIIRLQDYEIKPCTGCESCSMAMGRGETEIECVIKDDAGELLKKILWNNYGLIIAAPVYHLRSSGNLVNLTDRMLPYLFARQKQTYFEKGRASAAISVGGGEPEWTPMGLLLINLFLAEHSIIVDQMQANFCSRPGMVVLDENALERARRLGRNVVEAMKKPVTERRFLGEETAVSCPVCHLNIVQIPERLPDISCPICDVRGRIVLEGDMMTVYWDEDTVRNYRFSEYGIKKHLELIKSTHARAQRESEKIKERMKKYQEIPLKLPG